MLYPWEEDDFEHLIEDFWDESYEDEPDYALRDEGFYEMYVLEGAFHYHNGINTGFP